MSLKVELPPQSDAPYLIAVSGGVDSVALLHFLHSAGLKLIVAHFEHGIRSDSDDDARFVAGLAHHYGLEFKLGRGDLSSDASEEQARDARYAWLRTIKKETQATAIITAHHKDDVLETIIMNIQRGTGRHGLSSLNSSNSLIRPLLNASKAEVIDYSLENNLEWVQDSTNLDSNYTRNHIRKNIVPLLNQEAKERLESIAKRMPGLNKQIDTELDSLIMRKSHRRGGKVIPRVWFISLNHQLAQEVVLHLCRQNNVADYNQILIDSVALRLKVTVPGKIIQLDKHTNIEVTKRSFRLTKM